MAVLMTGKDIMLSPEVKYIARLHRIWPLAMALNKDLYPL